MKIQLVLMLWGSLAAQNLLSDGINKPMEKGSQYPKLLNDLNLDSISYNTYDTGKINVSFEVDTTGKVCNPQITDTFNIKFNDAVIDAVERLEFIPALQNGIPVHVRYVLPIVFQVD